VSARARVAALFAIAAVALALRLWGIGFGATQPLARPDEEFFALGAMGLFAHRYRGLANGWPEGYTALLHLVVRAEKAVYGDANLACLLAVRPLAIYLPARVLSAALGAATIFPVYGLGRAFRDEAAGLCAAAALAVNFLAVRDGHFAVTDAALCLLVALCLWACARGRLIAAGAFAGAAFGVKYAALALVIPCAIGGAAALRRNERVLRAVLLPTLAALVAFVAVSPAVLRDPGAFFSGVHSHEARFGGNSLRFYAAIVLPIAFGWAGLLLGAIGLLRRSALFAAAFAALVFVLLAPLQVPYARYASPLVPALAAGIGAALAAVLERNRGLFAALAAIALLPPAARSVQLGRLLAREGTRDLASRWLTRDGRPIESSGGWARVHALERSAQEACARSLPPHLRTPVPTLAGDSRPWNELAGRGATSWEELGRALTRDLDVRPPLPEAELAVEGRAPEGFVNVAPAPPLDPACWEEVARFAPEARGSSEPRDAFFVPLDPLAGAARPGPEVVVRRRVCGNSEATRTR